MNTDSESENSISPMNETRCHICGERTTDPSSVNWVLACNCGWIHRRCINGVVSNLAAFYPGSAIFCSHCNTQLKIEPPASYLAATLYNIIRRWSHVNNAVAGAYCVFAFGALSVTSGMTSLFFICGSEVVKKAFYNEPSFATDICLFFYTSATLICSLPWENNVLHFLRRGSHLPVIGRVLPIEDPDIKASDIIKDPIVGGVLLPFCAKMTGDMFFSYQDCALRRYITGGVAFLLVKGLLTMYYYQKKYTRDIYLDIENYVPENNTN